MAHAINNAKTDALLLIGGGVVGAGLALLLAPHSGKETRREIVRFGKTLGNKSDKVIHEFADSIADFSDSVGEKAVGILHSGQELTREGKKGILAAIEKGQKTLEHQKRRVASMIG